MLSLSLSLSLSLVFSALPPASLIAVVYVCVSTLLLCIYLIKKYGVCVCVFIHTHTHTTHTLQAICVRTYIMYGKSHRRYVHMLLFSFFKLNPRKVSLRGRTNNNSKKTKKNEFFTTKTIDDGTYPASSS